jgi:hypothetical protein
MSDDDREIAALIFDLSELDPLTDGGRCYFCGSYSQHTHYDCCLWKRAAALRWRASETIRGMR